MATLNTLYLHNNEIKTIEDYSFFKMITLETLTLNNNKLLNLEESALSGLFRLKYLNLSFNSIEHIKMAHFYDMFNLISLDLGHNNLKFISDSSFLNLRHLVNLFLNENPNIQIEKYSFDHMDLIKNIYLDMSLFLNENFTYYLVKSLHLREKKMILSRFYYESINIISTNINLSNRDECRVRMAFFKNIQKFNFSFIHFNLRNDDDVDYFISKCKNVYEYI